MHAWHRVVEYWECSKKYVLLKVCVAIAVSCTYRSLGAFEEAHHKPLSDQAHLAPAQWLSMPHAKQSCQKAKAGYGSFSLPVWLLQRAVKGCSASDPGKAGGA